MLDMISSKEKTQLLKLGDYLILCLHAIGPTQERRTLCLKITPSKEYRRVCLMPTGPSLMSIQPSENIGIEIVFTMQAIITHYMITIAP